MRCLVADRQSLIMKAKLAGIRARVFCSGYQSWIEKMWEMTLPGGSSSTPPKKPRDFHPNQMQIRGKDRDGEKKHKKETKIEAERKGRKETKRETERKERKETKIERIVIKEKKYREKRQKREKERRGAVFLRSFLARSNIQQQNLQLHQNIELRQNIQLHRYLQLRQNIQLHRYQQPRKNLKLR